MEYASSLFAALSDPLRLRCLALLARRGELCVCELTHALAVAQPKVSKHLAVLREVGLVRDRREAQWVLYAPADDLPDWVADAVDAAVRGVSASAVCAEDTARLDGVTLRPSKIAAG
ncbi:metalloregulator ArsR/SmtB family transcription factor [Magnetospirillum aberrantis]|uniref:Metalloregulator ArsR/SmtB family transcription factor n=1 Tax=Magnetospirillum aberrantis SpK TaxID=908842 RepID=A0A7C9UZL7_9PROT|nr:metalloregulator ArsR/SmtB family transcription factor [Magnetospirillum aberrantis]NFV80631.1 metalloregulator ArsR/SmtB family transcription factor [Magnetospirillum aberrantis SpK]